MARCPCALHRQDVTPHWRPADYMGDLPAGHFHLKLPKPAERWRPSLRATFLCKKKKRKSYSISGTKCKFDFVDETALLSLPDFIPHPHPSSHLLTSQDDFFFPPKRKELLVSMQSSRSTNGTLLFFQKCENEIFMTTECYLWEKASLRWRWRREQLSFWHETQIFPVRLPSFRTPELLEHLLNLWTFGEQTM